MRKLMAIMSLMIGAASFAWADDSPSSPPCQSCSQVAASLSLPSGAMTQSSSPSVTATLVDTIDEYQNFVTFSGLPPGLAITDGQTYLAWCVDVNGEFVPDP